MLAASVELCVGSTDKIQYADIIDIEAVPPFVFFGVLPEARQCDVQIVK